MVVQRKTQRPVQFELTEPTRSAVSAWVEKANLRPEHYLFPSRMARSPHVSTRQYARIVHQWVAAIGLDSTVYGTHTMRRTKATLIYKRTKNLRAVQLSFGHSKLASTVRYLGRWMTHWRFRSRLKYNDVSRRSHGGSVRPPSAFLTLSSGSRGRLSLASSHRCSTMSSTRT
jgi:site-specific recombinase XerC